jgi:hypothetical protein
MRREILSYRIFLIVVFIVILFLPPTESFSFPTGSNGWHLNSSFQAKANADIVCKVHVQSIRQMRIVRGNLFPGEPDLLEMIATSKVLSVVKGECPDIVSIKFRRPTKDHLRLGHSLRESYTDLSENEVCLVFLKASGTDYTLNRIQSKARVRPEVVDYDLGETPDLKLLAEFIAGCNAENEFVNLQAVEELGYLGDEMIRKL